MVGVTEHSSGSGTMPPVEFVQRLRTMMKEITNSGGRFIELADYRKKRSIVLLDNQGADFRVVHKRQSWKIAKPGQIDKALEYRIGGNDGAKMSIDCMPDTDKAEVHYEELFGADVVGLSAVVEMTEEGIDEASEIITSVHRELRDKERELRNEFQKYAGEVYKKLHGSRLTIRRELYDERLGRATKKAVLYKPTKVLLGPVLKSMFKIEVFGRENIPRRGGAIIASNHISFSDCLFIPASVERRVTFLAKKELFDGQLKNMLFRNWGQIPVDRGSGDKKALQTALNVLKSGHLLGIFPEGTRSTAGKMIPAHTGVARLALMARVPVIPCGLYGCDEILPKGVHVPRIRQAVVSYGAPMLFTEYFGKQNDRQIAAMLRDRIVKGIKDQIEAASWAHGEEDKLEGWTTIELPIPDDDLMLGFHSSTKKTD